MEEEKELEGIGKKNVRLLRLTIRLLGDTHMKTYDILRKSHTRLIIEEVRGQKACRSGLKAVLLQSKRVIKCEFYRSTN